MGDGRGGYGTERTSATELGSHDGHTLTRDRYGDLHDHGPHGIFGVRRVPGETVEQTIRRWRMGVSKGWYGR